MTRNAPGPTPAARPLRADARRNRDAILAAARETFERDGVFTSLDGIAVRAGVGNATLYRNFPTRDDLLAAAMTDSVAVAVAGAADLAGQPPRAALAEWMARLTWQLRTWHDLPACVADARADPGSPFDTACGPLRATTAALLERATAAGEVDPAVTVDELFELVTALSWAVDRFGDDEAAARRRVELGTAGIFTAR